ncbi:hypothetical protein [Endozoicomonas euniceicola]|uniref:Uncharacterized protein n=1 Tax=Endozoicomonas euniceicola TaxID=1234143 RepID=A0ABY6GP28_9GAMM|nr:hypothetical protein [Endozoicomonas euniceicola]UYM14169.1 hypothetical protein NX720_14775 [Endozoicomonas euniceicola]
MTTPKSEYLQIGKNPETGMPEEEFIINVYCLVGDLFKKLFPDPIRTRGFEPKLSDSEVITIEVVGEWLGHHKERTSGQ